jgi:FkbM family methyltransferase
MRILKSFVKGVLDKAGYVVSPKTKNMFSGGGMGEGFLRMREIGVLPDIVIDIGAAQGTWTKKAMRVWPNAKYELIEPLVENKFELEQVKLANSNINFHLAVAGEISGETWLEVSPDLDGSGVYGVSTSNSRKVPMDKVDDIIADLNGSILLKLDTHGYEMPILKGAVKAMKQSVLLIIEVYGFHISPTCLLFHELSVELEILGFRLIDIVDIMRRPGDQAFWQCDAFYIRKDHPVFKNNSYT